MRALAFARAVLARWDLRVVSTRPLGVVFLQRPARQRRQAPAVFSLRRDVHLHLRPQISLALVRSVRAAASETHYHRSGDRMTLLTPLVLRASAAVEAQRLVERLLVRGTSSEVSTGSVEGRSEPLRRAPILTQPPQLTVLRSDRATGDERREDRRELPGAVERSLAAAELRTPAHAAVEPGVDVGRLTDQVVAAIDRRLVAQAERLGRS